MGGNALLHQIDDELAHHFIAVRAGGDADAADRFAVRGVSAAFDAPSLFDGQGDAGDRGVNVLSKMTLSFSGVKPFKGAAA